MASVCRSGILNHSVMIATRRESKNAPTMVIRIVVSLPSGVDAMMPPYPTLVIVMMVNQSVDDID